MKFSGMCRAIAVIAVFTGFPALAETIIGSVSTTFRLMGANDKVEVTRYDDPRVPNASCYVSRAVTGGISGSFGLATDPSRFSIACRAVGPVDMPSASVSDSEIVFTEKASILFKYLNITRMLDREKKVIVYLVTSTKALDGSPFNSVSVVTTAGGN